ncbi:MAG: type 4a pilus biogenesis protein PilO [Elusimicrobiota bacterium]
MGIKNLQFNKDAVLRNLSRVKSELQSLQMVLKLKGAKYLQRPLAIGAVLVFASYFYFFQKSATMLNAMTLQVDAAAATATFADEYKGLKAQIEGINAKLPRSKNPQEWLLNSIRKTLREEGIVALSTSKSKEEDKKGYRFITITVELQASFPQLASWVSRLERNPKLLYIKALSMRKDTDNIGQNAVTVEVMTVIKGKG